MALPHAASAQSPTGGSVVAGTAGIAQAGAVTNINQSSQKAVINWQGFSVGAQNTVNFNQPNSSAATLNRVIGNEQSVINGAINANGQVFIVNSAGVLFGKGSQVNVGGLVASTLDISNNDFMAGNYRFSGTSSASVVNQGRIRAHGGGAGGGYVALLGKTVSNEGVIAAKLGTVAMASGEKITLNFGGDSLLDVTIDKGTLNALVQNKRAIIANGGQVIMTAKAADQVLSAQVNNTGIIQARTMAALKGGSSGGTVKLGKIKLLAQGGTTNVSGKLDASAPKGGDGGFIETSGDHVQIADNALIITKAASGQSGTWLIDPYNITISSSPTTNGSFNSGSPNTYTPTGTSVVNVATLQTALANNNVVITTGAAGSPGTDAGDITVNAAITTWSANTTLTLNAAHDITINKAITADGDSAGLALNAGNNINVNNAVTLNGAHATLTMAYGGYNGTTVTTAAAGTNYNILTPASYAGTVLDANGSPVAKVDPHALANGGDGVYGSITLSNSANTFSTNPNGLVINGQAYRLIHSMTELAAINNVINKYALAINVDAGGTSYNYSVVGTLAGNATTQSIFAGLGHTIDGLTITGSAGTSNQVSGLFGTVRSSTLRDLGVTNVNINVSLPSPAGTSTVGALAGTVVISGTAPSIVYNVYGTGTLTAARKDANGNVIAGTGFGRAGGLFGTVQGNANTSVINTVTNAFSTVKVLSDNNGFAVGGLIGVANAVVLANAHATGNVQGDQAGGLAGTVSGEVSNSYATGTITTGTTGNGGGLLGGFSAIPSRTGTVSNSFATGDVFGGVNNGGLIGGVGFSDNNVIISNVYATGDVHASIQSLGLADPGAGEGGLIGVAAGTSTFHLKVTNAHATGNVTAALNYGGLSNPDLTSAFGGLVGQFNDPNGGSLIENSYATGTVDASKAAKVQPAGGLVGRAQGVNIKGSYSTGAVIGKDEVGGLVGMFFGSGPRGDVVATIDTSWTTSTVTATNPNPSNPTVGALIGQAAVAAIGPDVFFNGGTAGGVALGDAKFFGNVPGEKNNSQGLTAGQLPDAKFYANGTINQVLADRAAVAAQVAAQAAAQAAAAQAAARLALAVQGARSATVVSNDAQTSSETPPDPSLSKAGASATRTAKIEAMDNELKAVDDKVKADDDRRKHERERRRTAQTSHRGHGGSHGGGGLGATIRSIDVNGQRFDLQNGTPKPDAPAGAPH